MVAWIKEFSFMFLTSFSLEFTIQLSKNNGIVKDWLNLFQVNHLSGAGMLNEKRYQLDALNLV